MNKREKAAALSGMSFSAKIIASIILSGVLAMVIPYTPACFMIAAVCVFKPSVVLGFAGVGASVATKLFQVVGKIIEGIFNALVNIFKSEKNDPHDKR